jgi:hydroxyacylglutathione hydrolase
MQIVKCTVGPMAMNCYLLGDTRTRQALLIDPGSESEKLIKMIEQGNWQLQYIVNTHCHIDHTAEAGNIQKYFRIPFYIHRQELPLLQTLGEQGRVFGMTVGEIPSPSFVQDGDVLRLGQLNATVLYTPGHSPGGISLSFAHDVFVGDTLFRDSIGRTDLYGGNHEQLIDSIKNKLFNLEDKTKVYSGHGPVTTIGRERKYNPYLTDLFHPQRPQDAGRKAD